MPSSPEKAIRIIEADTVVIAGAGGEILASKGSGDLGSLARLAVSVRASLQKYGQEMKKGEFEHAVVDGKNGKIIIAGAGEKVIAVVVSGDEGATLSSVLAAAKELV
ncbi:MAG: roadblock/LC7 domain-containing protein [Candidatus Micrarchaeota archaeon]|nr:roadblock/LC7 domain-containing protein [Candidatus Micrarchaeota archaeon]